MLLRAFDKTVRRKPLAFAADAVYGNSIDLEVEVVAKRGVARKALLLMFVKVLLLAFTPVMVSPLLFFFQAKIRLHRCGATQDSDWVFLSGVYAALGEKDEAFNCLEKAYQAHDFFLPYLKVYPNMDPLRSDARFVELLRRIGLPP